MTEEYSSYTNDKEFNIAEMRRFVETKQELDKFLEMLITPHIKGKSFHILDACCGIGHLCYFLSEISPQSTFVGIDRVPYLIEQARELCRDKMNISFRTKDIYYIQYDYSPKYFDLSICWKTLSWLPDYAVMIQKLTEVTKRYIFLSSLFYRGDIDFQIKVREYQKEAGKDGFNAYYNVYSLPKFKEFVLGLGVAGLVVYDFEIGIDLPRPPVDQMGTYTERLEDGRRLQISGAVVMSWKVIRIDL